VSSIRRIAPTVCLASILALGSVGLPAAAHGLSLGDRGGTVRPSSYGTSRVAFEPATGSPEAPSAVGVGAAPVASMSFDAIPRIGRNWPADPTGAVGTDWIVTAANASYALYEPGGDAVLGPAPFAPFFSFPQGTRVFSPKVVYDQYKQVFVMAFLAVNRTLRKSWVLLVSIPNATATDQSTWCGSKIAADRLAGDGVQWADYPGLGYDLKRVVLTANMFNFTGNGGFAYAQILSFRKTDLYDCSRTLVFDTITGRKTRNPDGTQAFTIQPSTSVGTSPTTQYFLSFEARASTVVVWRLGEAAAGPRLVKVALPVGRVKAASSATQGGGDLTNPNTRWDPGDLRFMNAFYDADLNRVYAAHTIARDLQPDLSTDGYLEAVVQWFEVEPRVRIADSRVTRSGVIGEPESDAGWPAVATDGEGNLFLAYSRASAVVGEYLSVWVASIPPGAQTGRSLLLAPGQARMEARPGPEPWGRYKAINRDPKDPARVAIVGEYAKADGSGPTEDWQQTFALVSQAA